MRAMHLSSIGHTHGELRPVSELDGPADQLAPLVGEVVHYRASDQEIWELGALAAESTVAQTAVTPDLLLYVTDGDPTPSASAVRIAGHLQLRAIDFLSLSGHECGNFGPALRTAADALHSHRADSVLLILADRARPGRRIMPNGLSVFSDGAAACILTREEPDAADLLRLDAVATRTGIPEAGRSGPESILGVARLAAASVADLLRADGSDRDDFDHLLFANYRPTAQVFLASAVKVPADRLLPTPVARYGHCYSADLLVTLEELLADGALTPGRRLLAASIGPYSWSTMAFTCVRAKMGVSP